jgi:hypothetical protein
MTEKQITKQCDCGSSFQTDAHPGVEWLEVQECPTCRAAIDAKIEERQRIEREELDRQKAERLEADVKRTAERIDGDTPARFLSTDTGDKRFNRALWNQVTKWMPTAEKPWLGLVGEAGASKTRCAYLRLRQLGEEWTRKHGRPPKFEIVTGPEFKRFSLDRFSKEEIQSRHWDGPSAIPVSQIASASLRKIKDADILLFDELGEKIKPTPAVIEELFALIDYRHSENKVTLWTCNSSPEEFCGGWPPEFAGPIAGRIVESSTIFKV